MCVAMMKLTIGYFLFKRLTSTVHCALIKECLRLLNDQGIRILALICDGASTNKSTQTMLGAKLNAPHNIDGRFRNPANGDTIFFHDVCHNIKLLRNLLADRETLFVNGTKKEDEGEEEAVKGLHGCTHQNLKFDGNKRRKKVKRR
ncbi:uncharacterized protein LOC121421590 [Lytechinus variegatus]|uniref:uncharacterized protein LOC121421590 n=1 Tax=Lytechinus variegatus TaxID=7654 RepID=UPI001BB13205|nr:uncharacterized protein LOC121421590 [Lytechinus variegatus]